jgi:flavocytochrome c
MKKILTAALGLLLMAGLVAGCGSSASVKTSMKAGVYTATVAGMHGPLSVEVKLGSGAITEVKVSSHVETPGLSEWPVRLIPERVVEKQSLAVEVVSGASITSRAILTGVEECLKQAGADVSAFKKPLPAVKAKDETLSADVVIVGGGGAGLAAAVAATNNGASVILIEKSGTLGGNSIMAGGIYNVANTKEQDALKGTVSEDKLVGDALAEKSVSDEHKALQDKVRAEFDAYKKSSKTFYDSPSWHALQTWNGGDKVGTLKVIQVLTGGSLPGLEWLMSMGYEYQPKVVQGAGALYQRTIVSVLPNGTGFISAFRDTLAKANKYTQLMETTGKSLIVEGGKVVGVNALGKDGHKVTLRANKGVILATGGFAGNVELRQKYGQGPKWPDLGPSLGTSNVPSVTGDGIFMAEAAGAKLVNMEQIQLLHVCNPLTGATGDISAPRDVAGYIFVNKNGQRFVREDGRRDDMSKAIIAQSDGIMYLVQSADTITDLDAVKTLDGRTVRYMLENNLSGYVSADTLADLAKALNMPAANLEKTVADFNSHVDSRMPDEFGRGLFSFKYTKGPWYAYPRKPAAHHTMGGVLIDENTHALKADGSVVSGLYCAGEITGVVHGANRLGGNAIVDFTVFGRIAGTNAALGK